MRPRTAAPVLRRLIRRMRGRYKPRSVARSESVAIGELMQSRRCSCVHLRAQRRQHGVHRWHSNAGTTADVRDVAPQLLVVVPRAFVECRRQTAPAGHPRRVVNELAKDDGRVGRNRVERCRCDDEVRIVDGLPIRCEDCAIQQRAVECGPELVGSTCSTRPSYPNAPNRRCRLPTDARSPGARRATGRATTPRGHAARHQPIQRTASGRRPTRPSTHAHTPAVG